ncbi:MAG: FtsX-like permease family protein, partial [Chloroflexota bacterium]
SDLVAPRPAPTVDTDLPAILADVGRSIVVSRSGVLLLTVQFAVLALYAIFLVAGMLVDRRRLDTALLRSRGASNGDLTVMAAMEALLLAAPAAVLAPILAVGIVRALGAVGPLAAAGVVTDVGIGGIALLIASLTALVCVVAFTVPAVLSATSPGVVRALRGRQLARTLPQRLGLDLVLVLLAGIGIWQLRLYGSPLTEDARGVLGLDPLLIVAPAIGLVAGAVLAVRFLPRLAEIAERVAARSRGSVSPLVARQLARRPLRYTRSSLLLMLAAALFTFAAAYAATWTRSQSDQAAYRAAADVRAIQPDIAELPAWSIGAAYREVPGVEAAMPVDRQVLDVGKAIRGGEVLGLDPTAATTIVTMPPGADGTTAQALFPQLAAGRPAWPAVALPGTPARLAMTIDAALMAEQTTPLEPTYPHVPGGVTLAAVLEDADGRLFRIEGGRVEPSGDGQTVIIPLDGSVAGTDLSPSYPLRLEAIELAVSSATGQTTTGTLDVTGAEVSDDATGDAWRAVSLDAGAEGWRWTRVDGSTPSAYVPPDGMPGRIAIGTAPGMSPPIERFAFDSGIGPTFRLWATGPTDVEVPAIAAGTFLEASGGRVGDAIAATSSGLPVTLRIVGDVGMFPPLDPAASSVVVDGRTVEWLRFATSGQVAIPDEWWLSVPDDESAVVAATLEAPPFIAKVVARTGLAASLSGDPIPLGVIGALGLGALAALVIAAIGFLVSASISTSERITEFALLRAIGISPRQLAAWLALEHAFLLAFGVVAGIGLGLLLAWLVLPFSALTASGAAAVPPPAVVVPWEAVVPLGLLCGVLYAVTVAIVTRQAVGISVAGVLRSREA